MYDYNTQLEYLDLNGDNIIDTACIYEDSNNNGVIDTVRYSSDFNNDGVTDYYVEAGDTDENGIIDIAFTSQDTTGDGYLDETRKLTDYNQDGEVDSMKIYNDNNYDGLSEMMTEVYHDKDGSIVTKQHYDNNFDGKEDIVYTETQYDYDQDGVIDDVVRNTDYVYNEYSDNPEYFALDQEGYEMTNYYGNVPEYTIIDYPNYDPEVNTGEISGNPAEAIEVWEDQGATNRCAVYSQKFVIEELTGQDIDIEEFADIAEANGWFDEDTGTTSLNMSKMLDYYGIENEMSFHNDINDIKECLDNGGKVIVSLDCEQIWYGKESNIFSPADSSNHAVEVIGIDYDSYSEPMVILNDSGTPDGRGEMIPLSKFEEAWTSGENQMITCYA